MLHSIFEQAGDHAVRVEVLDLLAGRRSLAVDAEGNVCVGTLENPGITVVSPDGDQSFLPMPGDALTTNLCFTGDDRRFRIRRRVISAAVVS